MSALIAFFLGVGAGALVVVIFTTAFIGRSLIEFVEAATRLMAEVELKSLTYENDDGDFESARVLTFKPEVRLMVDNEGTAPKGTAPKDAAAP